MPSFYRCPDLSVFISTRILDEYHSFAELIKFFYMAALHYLVIHS